MELDRRLQLELKRKLFASRENNSKIEKNFVNDLSNQFQGQSSAVAVQGGNINQIIIFLFTEIFRL